MRTIEDLKRYFEADLKTLLNDLEAKRLHVVSRFSFKPYKRFLKIGGLACIMAIALAISLPNIFGLAPLVVPAYALTAIIYPLVLMYKRTTQFEGVSKVCKETIVPKLLSFIDPEIHYQPERGLAREDFNNSLLFPGRLLSGYVSDDLIEFKTNNTVVQITNVEARRQGDRRQGQTSNTYIAFSGIFTRAGYPINSATDIIVKKDVRNSMVANAGKAVFGGALSGLIDTVATGFESLNITGDLVRFDDPDFEAQFNVYCSEPDTAKRILNEKVRKAVTAYAKQNDQDVHLSFTSNHLNIALWSTRYLEWELNDSFLDFEKFRTFLFPLLQSVNLAKELLEEKR